MRTIFTHAREQAVFALLLALFLLLITRNVSSEPYVYDEADYMYAASLGFAANWSDTPSIPIVRFRTSWTRPAAAGESLSERIRSGNDVLFYRHFHGPLFHYLLIPVSRLGLSEHAVRTAMLAIPCASLAVIYFGGLWLAPRSALVVAVLFLVQLFGDPLHRTGAASTVRVVLAREPDSSFESDRHR